MLRCGRRDLSDRKLVLPSATDFFLGEKVGKTPSRGHPLTTPLLRESPIVRAPFTDRHALEENIQRLPRCRYIVVIAALCLCFGVPGAGLICTEVCFTLGQRQLLTSLVADGPRAGRRSVLRWIKRRSLAILVSVSCADTMHDPPHKTGSPKPTGFRRRFADFFAEEKVGRRRQNQLSCRLISPAASRHGQTKRSTYVYSTAFAPCGRSDRRR